MPETIAGQAVTVDDLKRTAQIQINSAKRQVIKARRALTEKGRHKSCFMPTPFKSTVKANRFCMRKSAFGSRAEGGKLSRLTTISAKGQDGSATPESRQVAKTKHWSKSQKKKKKKKQE